MSEFYDDLAVTNTSKPAPVHELPTIGDHQGVLCQAHNIGHDSYKGRIDADPTAVLVFELDQKMTGGQMDGKPMVISLRVPMNMAEDSKLRNLVNGWKAPAPALTDAEAKAFTIRKLLSVPCTIIILHKPKTGGGMRAVIGGIARAKVGASRVPVTYTEIPKWIIEEKKKNESNKPSDSSATPAAQAAGAPPAPEDDLPF